MSFIIKPKIDSKILYIIFIDLIFILFAKLIFEGATLIVDQISADMVFGVYITLFLISLLILTGFALKEIMIWNILFERKVITNFKEYLGFFFVVMILFFVIVIPASLIYFFSNIWNIEFSTFLASTLYKGGIYLYVSFFSIITFITFIAYLLNGFGDLLMNVSIIIFKRISILGKILYHSLSLITLVLFLGVLASYLPEYMIETTGLLLFLSFYALLRIYVQTAIIEDDMLRKVFKWH